MTESEFNETIKFISKIKNNIDDLMKLEYLDENKDIKRFIGELAGSFVETVSYHIIPAMKERVENKDRFIDVNYENI